MAESEERNPGTTCEGCGADMTWVPAEDALVCAYCETRRDLPEHGGIIEEYSLDEAGSAARGLDLEVRVTNCESCGARVTFDEVGTAKNCVYCGSSSVLEQEANRNAIRPESLVPLGVGRDHVKENFAKWLKGLWFRPGDLKKQASRFDAIGIYVPYWTFDCRVDSDWTAESGTYYWVTETYTTTENGKTVQKTRQVRKTRWRPASGSRRDAYDDDLVCASRGIPSDLIGRLGGFDTSELVPYRAEYLAGWHAEEYELDLEGGWRIERASVEAEQESRCGGDVPGDTYRSLRVWSRIYEIRWRHVLLPVWSLAYRYKKKNYPVLVNGQTGRVVGKAPYSVAKILLFILVLVAIGVGVFLLISQR